MKLLLFNIPSLARHSRITPELVVGVVSRSGLGNKSTSKATTSSAATITASPQKRDSAKTAKRVTFNEKRNEYRESSDHLSLDDVWYSPDEIDAFRKAWNQHFYDLHKRKEAGDAAIQAWFCFLKESYESFCAVESCRDLAALLNMTPMNVFDMDGLGMERRVIPFVVKEALSRRKSIYAAVKECQRHPVFRKQRQSERIRHECRKLSLVSVVYARHVAIMSSES